jgi:ELWxxDGT repeat protein
VDGTLFFRANDFTHGYELWRSDGTRSGTRLVRDIDPERRPHKEVTEAGAHGRLAGPQAAVIPAGSHPGGHSDGVAGREMTQAPMSYW